MSDLSPAAVDVILAFADDEHLMGHRHSEWIGVAPFLEEDLAFASIGQDELGHAAALYELIDEDIDRLALDRAPEAWRSSWLVELPCHDWADALVRHWLYDTAELHRWRNMESSSVPGLAPLSVKAQREEIYHRRHAAMLIDRLLDATADANEQLSSALGRLLPYGAALFDAPPGESEALAEGVMKVSSAQLLPAWRGEIAAVLAAHDVDVIEGPGPDQRQRANRSEHFPAILHDLTQVVALDPSASW